MCLAESATRCFLPEDDSGRDDGLLGNVDVLSSVRLVRVYLIVVQSQISESRRQEQSTIMWPNTGMRAIG